MSGTKWTFKLGSKVHDTCGSLRFLENLCQQPIRWVSQVPMDSHASLEGTLLCRAFVVLGNVTHDFGDGGHDWKVIVVRAFGTSHPRSSCG